MKRIMMLCTNIEKEAHENELRLILEAIKKIRYGSITINIQDNRIVQIDKIEKIRIKKADQTTGG